MNTPSVNLNTRIQSLEKEIDVMKQNESRLESLLAMSQMGGVSEKEVREFALESVVALTRSNAGYLHFFDEESKLLNLVSWSKKVLENCTAAPDMHYPLDKAGIWADSVRLRRPVVHNDYPDRLDRRGYPEGHFPIFRHLSVPIFDQGKIVAVAGVGNKQEPYNETDIRQTMLFMNSMWVILQSLRVVEVLKKYSLEDPLTGLANRRRFEEFIDLEWRRAQRTGSTISVIMMDIDFFKSYNDIYGHQAGDDCLMKVANCLRKTVRRAADLIARFGGEEFILVLPETGLENAKKLAHSIRKAVADMSIPHQGSKIGRSLTISAGVACTIPVDGLTPADLIRLADECLYRVKTEGKDWVEGTILEAE